jgi:hypothetical protein
VAEYQEKKDTSSDEEILQTMRERFDLAQRGWEPIYKASLDDLKFLAGDQWPAEIKQSRESEKRPCLTTNRMPQFVNQITNDQRQNRPSIKISPVDDKADPEKAKVIQGVIRHIQVNSNADVARDTAFEGAVGPGFGFYRVITDYVDPYSFDQQAKIKAIPNQFSVLVDPNIKEPDGSDMMFGFVFEDVPHDLYKVDYKDSELCSFDSWDTIGNTAPGWIGDKTVRIAEYFSKDFEEITLALLSNGQVIDRSQLKDGMVLPEGLTIEKERKALVPVINHYKTNGVEILERTVFPGEFIPIIPVFGKIYYIDGERIIEGIIRHAKDPQRMLNFWVTSETELIALAPKAPFIMAEGQDEGYEDEWQHANSRTYSRLIYKPTSIDGTPVSPPIRNNYEPPVQAITNARMQSSEDLKATTGIYDAALGARSNENSGIAIQRRNMQSQTSNFHFVDNLTRSIRHEGRILLGVIREIYDAARVQRILGEDGEQEIIKLNELFQKKNGEEVLYDLSVGQYDVTVDTGPDFATKRQEALAMMMEFTKAVPQHAAMIADLIAKNADWPGGTEIADRLKKLLPPGLADDKEKKPIPPEVQAQMQQMGQMIDQLTTQLNAASDEIKTKKYEIEAKKEIELLKIERDYNLEILKLQGQAANQIMSAEISQINQLQDHSRSLQAQYQNPDLNQQMPMPDQQMQMPEMQQPQPTGGLPPGLPTGGSSPGPSMGG